MVLVDVIWPAVAAVIVSMLHSFYVRCRVRRGVLNLISGCCQGRNP